MKDLAVFRFVLAFAISVFYAYWLSSLPHELFKDRDNYRVYAQHFDEYLSFRSKGNFFFFISSEPLFLYINKALHIWFSPNETVKAIVFFNSFSVCFFCFRKFPVFFAGFFIFVLFVFNASILAQQLVLLRQGMGLAFLLLFFNSFKKETHRIVFVACLGLIHLSFFVFFFFLFFAFLLKKVKVMNAKFRFCALFFIGVFLFSLMGLLVQNLAHSGRYEYASTGGSGVMFAVLLPLFLFLVFSLSKKRALLHTSEISAYYLFACSGLIIMTAAYYPYPMFSGRMMGAVVPFLYAYLIKESSEKNLIVLLLLATLNGYLLFFTNGLEQGLLVSKDFFFRALFY